MNLTEVMKRVEKLTIDNSPAILTAFGVTGTLATAYLTGKATFKAANLIEEEKYRQDIAEKGHPLSNRDKLELVWKTYLPPALAGSLTVGAIICANRIGSKRAAAMAAAYTISEKAFSEYKEKVVEKLGEKKERAYRDEVAQDRVDRNPIGRNEVFVTGGGEVLCYDTYTGRYFYSAMETLKKAENDVNFQVLNQDYATLNDFYANIGLAMTKVGEEIGWTVDQILQIEYSTTISEDNKPCMVIDYTVTPVRHNLRPASVKSMPLRTVPQV